MKAVKKTLTKSSKNNPKPKEVIIPTEFKIEEKPVKNDPTRSSTGIPGFDGLIEGGFPKGKKILLEGKPGTGKSILALQFLYNGADKFNEKGLYLSFEQSDIELREQAMQFGWDLDKAGVSIIFKSPSNVHSVHELMEKIRDEIDKNGIKRLVIDSLPALYINATNVITYGGDDKNVKKSNKEMFKKAIDMFKKPVKEEKIEPKKFLYEFLNLLRCWPITTILISGGIENNDFGLTQEFVSDGAIEIQIMPQGEYQRKITIRKMRYTNNNCNEQPMEICKTGVIIHPLKQ